MEKFLYPYELRAKSLDERIELVEFGRVAYHLFNTLQESEKRR